MMSLETKQGVRTRLRRIAGQLDAIERMLEQDRPSVDLMHQLVAAQAALGKVSKIVLRSHVETAIAGAIESSDTRERKSKLGELMAVFDRYGQVRER